MRICAIYHRDYPWEVRIQKICLTLLEKKHEVHLICANAQNRKRIEFVDGITVHRLPSTKNAFLNKALSFPAFFNPIWIHEIYRVVRENSIDCVLVRDLPLALPAIAVARGFGIPIFYDMAENYPAMWKISSSIIKNAFVAHKMESISMRFVNKVFVVVQESNDRLIKKGVPESKIIIVSNTPHIGKFNNSIEKATKIHDRKLNLIYVGYIAKERGLDTVIKALPTIIARVNNVSINIIGEGKYVSQLRDLARNLNLNDHVNFLGWVAPHDLPRFIDQSDIGVIPHHVNDQTNATIPNKLFDFMAFAKPVIVSDAKPLERIVKEEKCGVVFKSGNPEDFAIKLLTLTHSTDRAEMGKNGQKAVSNKYNWQIDSKKLDSLFP
ncbi:MAG: glycosyltransferase family 4 protein [Candidatus Hodarchaeota archaeon]